MEKVWWQSRSSSSVPQCIHARVVKGEPERSVSEVAAGAAPNTSPYVSNRLVGIAVHAVV